MKRAMVVFLAILLAFSLISIAYANEDDSESADDNILGANAVAEASIKTDSTAESNKTKSERADERMERKEVKIEERIENLQERENKIRSFKERVKNGRGIIKIEGKKVAVRELSNETKELIAGKINAKTGLNLTAEDINDTTVLRAYLSNGRHAYVKVMPDQASKVALERLKAKCAERNCTVELKEVGIGNKSRLAYSIETDKDSRILFIFKKKMAVRAEVDAETGEIIKARKPWWSFMAKEKNEAQEEAGANPALNVSVEDSGTINASENNSINS